MASFAGCSSLRELCVRLPLLVFEALSCSCADYPIEQHVKQVPPRFLMLHAIR